MIIRFPPVARFGFQFAANDHRPALDLFWYDGSLKPPTPHELQDSDLSEEGMLFVGDKGKILAEFLGQEPRLISGNKPSEIQPEGLSADAPGKRRAEANALWVGACHGGPKTYGDFLLARPISDAFNLAAVSLRWVANAYASIPRKPGSPMSRKRISI